MTQPWLRLELEGLRVLNRPFAQVKTCQLDVIVKTSYWRLKVNDESSEAGGDRPTETGGRLRHVSAGFFATAAIRLLYLLCSQLGHGPHWKEENTI